MAGCRSCESMVASCTKPRNAPLRVVGLTLSTLTATRTWPHEPRHTFEPEPSPTSSTSDRSLSGGSVARGERGAVREPSPSGPATFAAAAAAGDGAAAEGPAVPATRAAAARACGSAVEKSTDAEETEATLPAEGGRRVAAGAEGPRPSTIGAMGSMPGRQAGVAGMPAAASATGVPPARPCERKAGAAGPPVGKASAGPANAAGIEGSTPPRSAAAAAAGAPEGKRAAKCGAESDGGSGADVGMAADAARSWLPIVGAGSDCGRAPVPAGALPPTALLLGPHDVALRAPFSPMSAFLMRWSRCGNSISSLMRSRLAMEKMSTA